VSSRRDRSSEKPTLGITPAKSASKVITGHIPATSEPQKRAAIGKACCSIGFFTRENWHAVGRAASQITLPR
jgi:hypothetical protein